MATPVRAPKPLRRLEVATEFTPTRSPDPKKVKLENNQEWSEWEWPMMCMVAVRFSKPCLFKIWECLKLAGGFRHFELVFLNCKMKKKALGSGVPYFETFVLSPGSWHNVAILPLPPSRSRSPNRSHRQHLRNWQHPFNHLCRWSARQAVTGLDLRMVVRSWGF